jgi:hypothetical protein
MYLSTLRNYIQAVGGELRIQAVFPDGRAIVIDLFGDYEERPYLIEAASETGGFRLVARPLHHQGTTLSTKRFKASGLTKTMRALHLPEVQIDSIKLNLELHGGTIDIGGNGPSVQRVFSMKDLMAVGFEEANPE